MLTGNSDLGLYLTDTVYMGTGGSYPSGLVTLVRGFERLMELRRSPAYRSAGLVQKRHLLFEELVKQVALLKTLREISPERCPDFIAWLGVPGK